MRWQRSKQTSYVDSGSSLTAHCTIFAAMTIWVSPIIRD
jgi:hypothetical protein